MFWCFKEPCINWLKVASRINCFFFVLRLAEKPVFHENTGTKTLFIGNKGVIECRAKAAPSAKNTWEKDGVKIDFTFSKYTLANHENLVIREYKYLQLNDEKFDLPFLFRTVMANGCNNVSQSSLVLQLG